MKRVVIGPVISPPKLTRYQHLSNEAQLTLAALELKYDRLLQNVQKQETPNDAAKYYKSIYDATFKRRNDKMVEPCVKRGSRLASETSERISNVRHTSTKGNGQRQFKHSFCSEVVMTHRPPDEEITQSILALTQRTSAPESPLMDFGSDISEDHEIADSTKSVKLGQHSNYLDNNISESKVTDHVIDEIMLDESKKKMSDSHSKRFKFKDTDSISRQSSNSVVDISENPFLSCQNVSQEKMTSPSLSIWCTSHQDTKLDENPCPTPEFSSRHKQSSQSLFEAANFDLNVSDYEIDSPLNLSEETHRESCTSEQPKPPFQHSLTLRTKRRESEAAVDEESPLCVKDEIISQSQKIKSSDLKRKSVLLDQTTRNFDVLDRASSQVKVKVYSKSNPHVAQTKTKRRKSGFKPPPRSQNDPSNTTGKSLQDFFNFENMTSQERQDTLESLKLSSIVAVTLLYEDGSVLCSTFSSAADFSKVKNLVVFAYQKCYLIPSGLVKREEIRCGVPTYEDAMLKQGFFFVMVLNLPACIKILELLSAQKVTKIICNSKEFLVALWHLLEVNYEDGRSISCANMQDPCIATWLLDPEQPPSSFKQMCDIAGIKWQNEDDTMLSCLKAITSLMKKLETKLSSFNQKELFTDIEMRLVPILASMETRAINIDASVFFKFSDILKSKLVILEESIYKEVGHRFSINSHVQLRQVLYEELKLDQMLPAKTKIGKTNVAQLKSTSEASLSHLVDVHPLPYLVLEYRQLQKLKSTYVDGMISSVHNGTLQTHWDQTAAATGRLTSSRPNIQAVPKTAITIIDYQTNYIIGSKTTSEAKINVREPFISRKGCLLLSADFQQIELRILAHLSEDNSLLSTFWQPHATDVFIALTAKWQGKNVDSVTSADREQTKRVVYSVLYGVGKDKLAAYLKVKPEAAKCLMSSFLAQFPAIDNFTKKCCDFAKEFGFTKTVCSRRRYFPHINSPSPVLRAQAQRQAVNFCVQGSAADICKLAMLSVEEVLQRHPELNCRLLFQIHDELIWEVQGNQIKQAQGLIQGAMENMKSLCGKFCNLQVPLAVSLSSGTSWAHLAPLDQATDLLSKADAVTIEDNE